MDVRFEKILIPVDFTINTEVAIRQALALAEPANSVLHLLHVQPAPHKRIIGYNIFSIYNRDEIYEENDLAEKFYSLQNRILQECPHLRVSTHVLKESAVEAAIIAKAGEIAPDLILVAKRSHHSLFPFLNTVVPSRIALRTRVPILISKPGSLHQAIKTIVIPVGKKFPQRKIDIVNALRKKARLHIRLLAFSEENSKQVPELIIHIYRLLRQGTLTDIHYEMISGKNKARALLSYCQKVEADLLVATADLETKIGWLNKDISDILPAASKTQVLAI